jgi:hypothetical protein
MKLGTINTGTINTGTINTGTISPQKSGLSRASQHKRSLVIAPLLQSSPLAAHRLTTTTLDLRTNND